MSIVFSGIRLKWGLLQTELMKYIYLGESKFKIRISTHYPRGKLKTNPIFRELEFGEILNTLDELSSYRYKIKYRKSKTDDNVYRWLSMRAVVANVSNYSARDLLILKINFLIQCALNGGRKRVTIPTNSNLFLA